MSGARPEAPVGRPALLQAWRTMTFLHWSYDPAVLRPLVPADLELDRYDGLAWVTLVAFEMVDVRLPGLPPAPRLSSFPEINVRTYVRGPDRRDGIWFFSLDAASLPTVLGGRAAYGVPYHWAAMSVEAGDQLRYRSRRRDSGFRRRVTVDRRAHCDLDVAVGPRYADTELTELDHFLTARWRAYGTVAGRRVRVGVEHPPWPLYAVEVLHLDETLTTAAGLPAPTTAPRTHYSPGVEPVRLALPAAAASHRRRIIQALRPAT